MIPKEKGVLEMRRHFWRALFFVLSVLPDRGRSLRHSRGGFSGCRGLAQIRRYALWRAPSEAIEGQILDFQYSALWRVPSEAGP
jgi:hypothetical protein